MSTLNELNELLGQTLAYVYGEIGDDQMELITKDGRIYLFYHEQDCCESVAIEDIIGDLSDLIGEPLTEAEEVTDRESIPENDTRHLMDESFTWTFYKFRTRKGSVTIRWLGESNGYYSEEVNFKRVK